MPRVDGGGPNSFGVQSSSYEIIFTAKFAGQTPSYTGPDIRD